jgi:hypothetical protein
LPRRTAPGRRSTGDASRWLDGRLRTLVGAGVGRANLHFYGLGFERARFDRAIRYSLDFGAAMAQANWQLAPGSPWVVGLRYVYAGVTPKLRGAPLFPGLADRMRLTISARAAILEFDTRDNFFTPTRGAYAESSWLASREALGASDGFESLQQVLMGWVPLHGTMTLGLRGDYAWSSAGRPSSCAPSWRCAACRRCATRATRWPRCRPSCAGSSSSAGASSAAARHVPSASAASRPRT